MQIGDILVGGYFCGCCGCENYYFVKVTEITHRTVEYRFLHSKEVKIRQGVALLTPLGINENCSEDASTILHDAQGDYIKRESFGGDNVYIMRRWDGKPVEIITV